jgi:hypothetical protein
MDYARTILHTSQVTIGHGRSSQSVTAFNSRCLVAVLNGVRSLFLRGSVVVNAFFSIYLILVLPAALGPDVYPATNRTEYQKMFLGSRLWQVRRPDNLTAIYVPIV